MTKQKKNEIQVTGKKQVAGIEFTGIEGGFGEGKKAMLVKEIAGIHEKTVPDVNKAINRNIKRFVGNLDLIDLKTWSSNDYVLESFKKQGIFTQAEIGNANNIYLLSERGYSKLLKILEDDVAWDLYEKLVDGYFQMRAEKKTRKKPSNLVFRQEMDMAKTLANVTGIQLGIACAVAINRAEEKTGESFAEYKKLLPVAKHETGFMNPTMIGSKLGNVKAKDVNLLLQEYGLQYKEDKSWRLTDEGMKYGEEMPYERNNHSGYQVRWNENVIEFMKEKVRKEVS